MSWLKLRGGWAWSWGAHLTFSFFDGGVSCERAARESLWWTSVRVVSLQWPLWVLLCTVLYHQELQLLQFVQSCSMLMFLSVLSLTSRRCCDSLHARQKLSEKSLCGRGSGISVCPTVSWGKPVFRWSPGNCVCVEILLWKSLNFTATSVMSHYCPPVGRWHIIHIHTVSHTMVKFLLSNCFFLV